MKVPHKLQRYGLEFVTVFLGVSLSLLAENWRQRRADVNAEHNSLAQLHSDLRQEQGDMRQNLGRAQTGLQSARFLIRGVRGQSPDSVSRALTGLVQCSFFIPHTSEYTALKSSGRLTIIEEPALREQIVNFYEMDPFIEWLHERDCLLTGELMDSLLGKMTFIEPTTRRDSLRAMRDDSIRSAGGTPDTTANARRGGGGRSPSRYPIVVYEPGQEGVLEDPVLHDRLVRLAAQRSYLVEQLQNHIDEVDALRSSVRGRLGADTLVIQTRNRSGNTRRGAVPGSRRP